MGGRWILSVKYFTNIRDIQWLEKQLKLIDDKAVKNWQFIQLCIVMFVCMLVFDFIS